MTITLFFIALIFGIGCPMFGVFMLGVAIFLGGVWLLGFLAEMLDD